MKNLYMCQTNLLLQLFDYHIEAALDAIYANRFDLALWSIFLLKLCTLELLSVRMELLTL